MDVPKAVVNALQKFSFVKKIILFGSRARGDHQERSDYDIAVICPDATYTDWVDLLLAIEKIPTLLSIQLVRLDMASGDLRQEIQKEGIVLYEQKG